MRSCCGSSAPSRKRTSRSSGVSSVRSHRAEALPGSLFAVAILAVAVNFVELLCTAGFPAIYTAVLVQHDLAPAAHYAYLGLYILGYVADDALMVGVAVIMYWPRG